MASVECFLDDRQGFAVRQGFDRLDVRAVHLDREEQATPRRRAVDRDGAGTANPVRATDMRTGQSQFAAQKIHQ